MLAAPLSAIIKMKRWSNQHNTNGNSITTKETEGDLFVYFPLRWEKALMVQRKTVSERWGRPHLDRITMHETGDVSGSQQKLFISVFLCSVWKNTWTRSSSFYAHCSAGHASTVAVLHIHTYTHNGSIVVVLFLNVLIPFLFKPLH